VQLYRHFVSQSSEFCRHNPLCCFSTSVYCSKRYRLSPETFRYTLLYISRLAYIHTPLCVSNMWSMGGQSLFSHRGHTTLKIRHWSVASVDGGSY